MHVPDLGTIDVLDLPARFVATGDGQPAGAEGDPGLAQLEGLIEIGQRVQLHRVPAPGRLDHAAQFRGQPLRLVGVAGDDLLIAVLMMLAYHRRDRSRLENKTAFQVSQRSTR